jgi:hypothetical protein
MHEFTTDILQIRFVDNQDGLRLLKSLFLQDEIQSDVARTEWLYDSAWLTLAAALALTGSQLLDMDPTEIAVIVRRVTDEGVLGGREIILYDTTAGGAGYARQLGGRMGELFDAASTRLASCDCQDSCYACLRTYHNQLIHSRLHRKRISEGLSNFTAVNFNVSVNA